MAQACNPEAATAQPPIYQVRLRGELGPQWAEWFEGWALALDAHGDTLLTGPVADQAALHGLLRKVRDLGIPLLSINCIDPGDSGFQATPGEKIR